MPQALTHAGNWKAVQLRLDLLVQRVPIGELLLFTFIYRFKARSLFSGSEDRSIHFDSAIFYTSWMSDS